MVNLEKLFEEYGGEFLKFERIEFPPHCRPDLCAFLLLDSLVPETEDIVASAEHDQIWLGVDAEKLAQVITQEEVIELIRCGVRWDSEFDCLAMFV